ncbi:MAG: hypothetical protein HOV80_37135 [Polyangiaceae bacterium]|nr:hypothetical protein [Polyangiaceae bacterium]
MVRFARALALVALLAPVGGCGEASQRAPGTASDTAAAKGEAAEAETRDDELTSCEAAWKKLEAATEAPGTRQLREDRAAFLGRARGAMSLLVRPPQADATDKARQGQERLFSGAKGYRVSRFVAQTKYDKPLLRSVVLRDGYLFADDAEDAFELEARVKLTDLFDEPRIVLDRGEESFVLERTTGKNPEYVFADGASKGKAAKILFLDRVRIEGETLGAPIHRDIMALTRRTGFDRMELVRLAEEGMLVRLRYGDVTARAVIESKGPKLDLACLNEPKAVREQVAGQLAETAWRRRALKNMRAAVSANVDDALPFDRPREETGPDKDGTLRPYWMSAYLSGRQAFEVDDKTYQVFLPDGRPHPPMVCVDFVLESWERASGSWFAPRGEKPRRIAGRLDVSSWEAENRRGVLGFGKFAEEHPDLFEFRKFEGQERIPFAKRDEFFAFLMAHTGELRAGDVLAIHGLKRDERVHQHAILLEEIDPLTGFPAGLADQMKNPRRRTWEGIMAEAPKRSLLFRARPKDAIISKMDDAPTSVANTSSP